eukprot:GHVN01041514.1.p1 GENE.GHVN01041514.1~~GHVN01041514.1.p1  ORF type:complete len:192 (-),score=22.41 GHVN01041514.1:1830-2405(-)
MTCTGATSVTLARTAMIKLGKRITRKLHVPVKFTGFEVKNLFGSIHLGFGINMRGLFTLISKDYPQRVEFNPEKQSGVKIQFPIEAAESLKKPPLLAKKEKKEVVTVNIFHSGKATVTGARSEESVKATIATLHHYFLQAKVGENGMIVAPMRPKRTEVAPDDTEDHTNVEDMTHEAVAQHRPHDSSDSLF